MKSSNTLKNIAAVSLISLSALMIAGCQTDSDPISRYEGVKKSVAPHGNHTLPVIYEKIEIDPQEVLIGDLILIEEPNRINFLEGKEDSIEFRVRAFTEREISFNLRTEKFPGNIQPVQDKEDPTLWRLTWKPESGFVKNTLSSARQEFEMFVDLKESETDPELYKALKNHRLSKRMSLDVFRDIHPPEILSIDWEGKKEDSNSTLPLSEGEIKEFSVTIKVPGFSKASQPELDIDWRPSLDSEKNRIMSGIQYVYPSPNKKVVQKDHNTWVYPLVFDSKNFAIAYPAQVASDKALNSDLAHYRVSISAYQRVDFTGERKDLKVIDGPSSYEKVVDFKVKYTGHSTRIIFPWDDGRNSLEACPGERLSYTFDVKTDTGIGKMEVDADTALANFKKQAKGQSALSCVNQKDMDSTMSCTFQWLIPADIKDGTYKLSVAAQIFLGDSDQPLVEKRSSEGILVSSKNASCNVFKQESSKPAVVLPESKKELQND